MVSPKILLSYFTNHVASNNDLLNQDFIIACGNDKQFVALCQVIGLPKLPNDPRFLSNALRIQQSQQMDELLRTYFKTNTARYWVDLIHAVKVPVGLMNNLQQAFEEPQVIARNMLVEMIHPLKE